VILLISGLWPLDHYGQVVLAGSTVAGMDFSGSLISLHEGILFLQSASTQTALQIGIPLESIDTLSLSSSVQGEDFLLAMESCVPLLPYLSTESLVTLMERILPSAERWSWESLYLWSGRIEQIMEDPHQRIQATLKKLQAMMELGQLVILGEELKVVNKAIDPLRAPTHLCWLNTEYRLRTGDIEEARYWANLPEMQIPASSDEVPARLSALMKEFDDSEMKGGQFR